VKYAALIRGIIVGGNSIIPTAKLRAAFEGCGVKNVSTFIASGNVLFQAPRTPKLEARLRKVLGLPIRLALRTHTEMEAIVKNAPKGFGTKPDDPAKKGNDGCGKPGIELARVGLKVLHVTSGDRRRARWAVSPQPIGDGRQERRRERESSKERYDVARRARVDITHRCLPPSRLVHAGAVDTQGGASWRGRRSRLAREHARPVLNSLARPSLNLSQSAWHRLWIKRAAGAARDSR
jgi:hypothetical protein